MPAVCLRMRVIARGERRPSVSARCSVCFLFSPEPLHLRELPLRRPHEPGIGGPVFAPRALGEGEVEGVVRRRLPHGVGDLQGADGVPIGGIPERHSGEHEAEGFLRLGTSEYARPRLPVQDVGDLDGEEGRGDRLHPPGEPPPEQGRRRRRIRLAHHPLRGNRGVHHDAGEGGNGIIHAAVPDRGTRG